MQNTRQRIMNYLKANHKATAVELSSVFRMTSANIRHHLSILEKQGQVEVIGQNEPNGRGRPNLIYIPTRQSQEHGLDLIADVLLDNLVEKKSSKQRESGLQQIADRLRAEISASNQSIALRLGVAVERMNELRYDAHWEAHADSPRLFLGQCPYATIIEQHPELCQIDQYLLEGILGCKVKQIEKISRQVDGSTYCIFALQE
jgi:predicted ArsR family transcriptional regulator